MERTLDFPGVKSKSFEELVAEAIIEKIKSMNLQTRLAPESWPPVLGVKEIQEICGGVVGEATIRKWFERADFPRIPTEGNRQLVGSEAFARWINDTDWGKKYRERA